MTVATSPSRRSRRPPTVSGTVLVVVPNAEAMTRIAGSLGYLSARKYRVHVGVDEDPPGAPNLALFNGRYPGITVARLPRPADDRWRTFRPALRATVERIRGAQNLGTTLRRGLIAVEHAVPPPIEALALLQEQPFDRVIVTRLDGDRHLDYLKAARHHRIPSIYLALDSDDVTRGRLAEQMPDCVAVWNRAQRREAVEQGVPVRHTCVIGAHLPTDVLEARASISREEYCRGLGADGTRRLVLLAAPGRTAREVGEWVRAWNADRLSHPDRATHQSAVIVVTRAPAGAEDLSRDDLPGIVDVIPIGVDRYASAQRLHHALSHADAIVSADVEIVLEGVARARPVLAIVDQDGGALGGLCARMRQEYEWPQVARSIGEQMDRVAAILNGMYSQETLGSSRGFVRIHGGEVEPGFLLIARLMRELGPAAPREPVAARHERIATWLATATRPLLPEPRETRKPAPDAALFMLVLPSAGALAQWESLMDALVARGHRVVLTLMSGGADTATAGRVRTMHGVAISGSVGGRGGLWHTIARGVSAIDVVAPGLDSERSGTVARWRGRLDNVVAPAWVRGIRSLGGRSTALQRVRHMAATLDGALPPSKHTVRTIEREQPDAVIALPTLDPRSVIDEWAAQSDVVRAARRRGIPAAASIAGATAIDELLAHSALRPRGLSRANADALVLELEQWWQSARRETAHRSSRSTLRALGATGALVTTIWTSARMHGLGLRLRSVIRNASRAKAAIRRAVRSDT